ncbi:RNA 2',3'-cyclic phosphodiesterase [Phytomonospora endophytica]|uniref:RNA 2',3'-cyclic phosphodiesterase n=1 Tax=Phytomonospora endophytica TaxID=714109 RepID=A0A841FIS0_9ACTN|nr:RNA 2',3'-cyclic phosphodiesterase [Phytomonospora endophytica]MBB6037231.1 2'-5' RNA ligase [Phytomonospora endophytica]GIG71267.1 RNA 2',3'-cyclic phosphodiesterase [Phytomonospora endophytica]
MTTARLFVAVYPPAEVVTDLGPVADGLHSARSRPMPHHQWHFTLAFIGPVDGERLADVRAALSTAAAEVRYSPPIRLRVAGGGTFQRDGRSTVLWAAVEGDTGPLTALAETVRAHLSTHRIGFDERPLKAHLTLARPGGSVSGDELAADLDALKAYRGPAWSVGEIALVESRGDNGTVHYEVLDRWSVVLARRRRAG